MTVKEVLRKVLADDEFPVQLINKSITNVKQRREGDSEVSFLTDAITPSQFDKEQEPAGLNPLDSKRVVIMTVREAFAAAGHPVLARCKIVYAYDGYYSEFDLIDDDNVNRVVDRIKPDWWTVENPPYRNWEMFDDDDGWVDPGNMMCPCGYYKHGLPDLSNLPAIDCLDALPECVRKAVEANK